MISPILLYISEVWGAYMKTDFNKWDNTPTEKNPSEILQVISRGQQKGKQLGLHRAELGKFPLLISIYKKIINYNN
jgi:hypothetical protein